MKTYIFTFDVNGGDDIKTGILQTQNKPRADLPENIEDIEKIKEIVKRCITRFVYVNEKNYKILNLSFWREIYSYLKTSDNCNKKLEINILSYYFETDQKRLNEIITDVSKKYDIYINCCNIDPSDDYFIYEGQNVVYFNQNDYTTKEIQIS